MYLKTEPGKESCSKAAGIPQILGGLRLKVMQSGIEVTSERKLAEEEEWLSAASVDRDDFLLDLFADISRRRAERRSECVT